MPFNILTRLQVKLDDALMSRSEEETSCQVAG